MRIHLLSGCYRLCSSDILLLYFTPRPVLLLAAMKQTIEFQAHRITLGLTHGSLFTMRCAFLSRFVCSSVVVVLPLMQPRGRRGDDELEEEPGRC